MSNNVLSIRNNVALLDICYNNPILPICTQEFSILFRDLSPYTSRILMRQTTGTAVICVFNLIHFQHQQEGAAQTWFVCADKMGLIPLTQGQWHHGWLMG